MGNEFDPFEKSDELDAMEEAGLQEDRLMEFELIQDMAQMIFLSSLEDQEESSPSSYKLEALVEQAFTASEMFHTIANSKRKRYIEYGGEEN